MSRMYNQTGNLYKGVFDCLYKTVTTEGLLAIYKGYFAHLARILPHTVSTTRVPWISNLANGGCQILTLTFAEQTNKFVRGIESRWIPETIKEKL
jgi:solute carrier family 25, member 34/35